VANLLGAATYIPLAVGAGYAVGYGLGPYVERLRQLVGEVEHIVLVVAVAGAAGLLGWRAFRRLRRRKRV
jgi:membrane protein DedA with SNARE-associated domain